MNHFQPDTDVIIIGGGPAGAAMGAYLAKAGARCVVLERELFPRPHVGESLVPSSTRVFRDLDFLGKMDEAGFPRKFGAIWTSTFSKAVYSHEFEELPSEDFVDIRFDERKQEGVERKYTYHVDRGIFDQLLLHHAHQLGAVVCEGVDVLGADMSDPSCTRVRFAMGRKEFSMTARVVIDASGRRTLLGSQFGLKVRDPVFDQIALHAWFGNFDRTRLVKDPSHEGYIHVHFLPIRNSWVWQIPINETTTSIGVVTQKKHFPIGAREEGREAFFWKCVDSRPELAELLRSATQVRPLKTEGDYSYAMTQITGDRMVLIGDAARFVDPIFSTGVSIALNCARFASRDVLAALETGDFSADRYNTYRDTIRRGTRNWYNFIGLYYRLNVLFTAFIRDPAHRLDILKLLQGDVYDEDSPAVLEAMREKLREIEAAPRHPWKNFLGELTAEELKSAF